jgi:hypothetical protein
MSEYYQKISCHQQHVCKMCFINELKMILKYTRILVYKLNKYQDIGTCIESK